MKQAVGEGNSEIEVIGSFTAKASKWAELQPLKARSPTQGGAPLLAAGSLPHAALRPGTLAACARGGAQRGGLHQGGLAFLHPQVRQPGSHPPEELCCLLYAGHATESL